MQDFLFRPLYWDGLAGRELGQDLAYLSNGPRVWAESCGG